MQRTQKGNREVIANKLQEHFIKIRRVVEAFELRVQNKMEELMAS